MNRDIIETNDFSANSKSTAFISENMKFSGFCSDFNERLDIILVVHVAPFILREVVMPRLVCLKFVIYRDTN